MKESIEQLNNLIESYSQLMLTLDDLENKPRPDKWSKKEILGHLIDSAVNNLQRFTEIQFLEKPYLVRKYKQDQLVIANGYQVLPIAQTVSFWVAINRHISSVISSFTDEQLAYPVIISKDSIETLKWLAQDYVKHMEYHLLQIVEH